MKEDGSPVKRFETPERYMAVEFVVRLDNEGDRVAIEEAVMDVLCDCADDWETSGKVCRMQYMGGTAGTLNECFKWLDPEMDMDEGQG